MRLGYARCSKDEQVSALAAQVARLREAGCEQVIEELISGGDNDRPGVLDLIKRIERGEVTELLITRVDRLGRDAQFADALLAMCAQRSISVRALDGGEIESATPGGFLVSRIFTTVAEHERRMLSLRLKSQFAQLRKQGRSLRKRVPFGYDQQDGKLLPHPDNWDHALRVIERLDHHRTFSKTAQELTEWCPWTPAATNLRFWWVNPVIRGHLPHLWDRASGKGWSARWAEIYYDQHEPLISENDWQSLTSRLRQTVNRFEINGASGGRAKHALTGLAKCSSCGHRLTRNTSNGTAWWRCRHRLCNARAGAREDALLRVAVGYCLKQATQLAQLALAPPGDDPRRAPLLQELETAQAHLMRNPHRRSAELAVAEIQAELQQLERQPVTVDPVQLQQFTELLQDPATWGVATAEELRTVLNELLFEIRVGRGDEPIIPIVRPR